MNTGKEAETITFGCHDSKTIILVGRNEDKYLNRKFMNVRML